MLQKHHHVLTEGLGECMKVKALQNVRPEAAQVFRPNRPLPHAALPVVEQRLERFQKMGIIEPVNV